MEIGIEQPSVSVSTKHISFVFLSTPQLQLENAPCSPDKIWWSYGSV